MTSRSIETVPAGFGKLGSLALDKPIELLESPEPVCILETDSLKDAIEVLQGCRIGCAVVVDDQGKIKGILSERDIVIKWALSEADPAALPVTELMTADPASITNSSTIASALYLMSKGGFRHLPVVDDNGKPTGMISSKDVMDFISMEFMRQMFQS